MKTEKQNLNKFQIGKTQRDPILVEFIINTKNEINKITNEIINEYIRQTTLIENDFEIRNIFLENSEKMISDYQKTFTNRKCELVKLINNIKQLLTDDDPINDNIDEYINIIAKVDEKEFKNFINSLYCYSERKT